MYKGGSSKGRFEIQDNSWFNKRVSKFPKENKDGVFYLISEKEKVQIHLARSLIVPCVATNITCVSSWEGELL